MKKNPMETIKEFDNELFENIKNTRDLAFESKGILSLKTKLLIALALDASKGAVDGVKSLAIQAKKEGATLDELKEVLRITNYISGVGSIYTAARGLEEII